MSNAWKKWAGWTTCISGGFVAFVGVWAIGSYVWGVVSVLDEPDQSWMFWGLAILFVGVVALGLGIGLIAAGRMLLKRV